MTAIKTFINKDDMDTKNFEKSETCDKFKKKSKFNINGVFDNYFEKFIIDPVVKETITKAE